MTFQQKYQNILNLVKEEIEQVLENLTEGIELKEPLKSKLLKLLNAPAKHIRPLVSFLYLKASGIKIDDAQILYQSAIELVHNASLIHDDVIDESACRRGVETLNSQFGNKLAVITGDYLISLALDKVLKIGSIELVNMFRETLEIMSTGEINQHFSKFKIPTIEEYIQKSEQKTAKLFETALCGSLLIANTSSPLPLGEGAVVQAERAAGEGLSFAKNFGLAFQIRDDLINSKTTKTDIADGIYTAPVIFSGGTENIEIGIEKTQILLNNTIENALQKIENFEDNKYKTALKELLGLLENE